MSFDSFEGFFGFLFVGEGSHGMCKEFVAGSFAGRGVSNDHDAKTDIESVEELDDFFGESWYNLQFHFLTTLGDFIF